MFPSLMFSVLSKAICMAFCHFLGWCCGQDGCPGGICEDAIEKLESVDAAAPSAHPAKVSDFGSSIDWSMLKEVIDDVMKLLSSISKFFGKDGITVG